MSATADRIAAAPPRHWAAALVGTPWAPECNCWWLVRHVQAEHFGRELPHLEAGAVTEERSRAHVEALIELTRHTPWRKATFPAKAGDVLVVQGAGGAHVGVMVQVDRKLGVLHSPGYVDPQTGRPIGSVRFDPFDALAAMGYGRPALWRYGQ
jgi:cell wall-associated NlpC family hydrolase